ncbi:hypothetical protein Tco_0287426 [Tanacetum coccineum]
MSGPQDEIPPPPPPPPSSSQTPTQPTPHTVSTIKLPILKKGEYDIWAMKMEHYLAHTDYPIWEVIQNGNGPVSITTDTSGQIKVLPPRTAEEIVAREKQGPPCLWPLPEDHLAKFQKMINYKEWHAKENVDGHQSRFGGNDESKKMQKYILKQQFEGFSISNTEGLHKGYDRFQSLLSQLEIHGAGVSTEDANQKFLRSLPSAWSQVSLIMRTKPGVDTLSFDDLYNNLRVFESDIKGSTVSSSSSPQNVAFVSEKTNSTNEVSTAYCVPNLSGQNIKYEQTSSYSLLANQSSCPQTDHEAWNRLMRNFARECRIKGTQDNRRRDAWNSGNKDGGRTVQKGDSKALVTIDGEGVDWSHHSEDEDYALMACNSSDSDTESVFMNKESDIENQPVYDRFAEGIHVVPPPMTGNYMPSGPEIEIDYSQFTYGPKQTQPMSEPVVNDSNVECQPKVWSDALIIEEYESDSDDDLNHLIRDCDFHEKRMARKAELNNVSTARASSTKNFSTARQSFNRQTDYPHRALKNKGIVDSGCSSTH